MEVASAKYLYGAAGRRGAARASTSTAPCYYRGEDGRLQMSLVPWAARPSSACPVATWRDADRPRTTRAGGWIRAPGRRRSTALRREKARARRCRRFDACVAELLEEPSVSSTSSSTSLLYEGYALYPYTPARPRTRRPRRSGSSTRPPTRAGLDTTFDHLELRCVVEGAGRGRRAEVRFLAPSGERHQARAAARSTGAGRASSVGGLVGRHARSSVTRARRRAAGCVSLPRREPHRGAPAAWTAPRRSSAR